jgi:hypothetical protein
MFMTLELIASIALALAGGVILPLYAHRRLTADQRGEE